MAECSFTVTVEDGEDPFVQCVDPIHLVLAPGSSTKIVNEAMWAALTTADNSPWPVVVRQPELGDLELVTGGHDVSSPLWWKA